MKWIKSLCNISICLSTTVPDSVSGRDVVEEATAVDGQLAKQVSGVKSSRWPGSVWVVVPPEQTWPTSSASAEQAGRWRRRSSGKKTWKRVQSGPESEVACRRSRRRSFGKLDRSVDDEVHNRLLSSLWRQSVSVLVCHPCRTLPLIDGRLRHFTARRYAQRGLCCHKMSVRHTPVFCRNG